MLLYTHLVWTLGLQAFFGSTSWVNADAARIVLGGPEGARFAWSYFWLIESPAHESRRRQQSRSRQ